jgi:cytochrome P450
LARQERHALSGLSADHPDLGDLFTKTQPRRTPMLLTCDPPQHQRQRALLAPTFRPSRVRVLEPRISELAHHLVDGFAASEAVDIMSEFAAPLPVSVIAHMLGVGDVDRRRFKQWSDDYVRMFGNHELSQAEIVRVLHSQAEFFDYLRAEIEQRRITPRADVMTEILNARVDDHVPFTVDEMLAVFGQFLVAGNETTTSLIGSAVLRLAADPDLAQRLRTDPSLVDAFIEEVVRLESPAQGFYRRATREATVGGAPVARGDYLLVLYGSANRDAHAFLDADRLDLQRTNPRRHVGFGFGEHFCVGAGLGRLEAAVAVRVLLQRAKRLSLSDQFVSEYEPSYIKRSLAALPVNLHIARGVRQ